MKKLITERTLRDMKKEGKTTLVIDGNTIITPLARDYARTMDIAIIDENGEQTLSCRATSAAAGAVQTDGARATCDKPMSKQVEIIVEAVMNVLKEKGLLDKILR